MKIDVKWINGEWNAFMPEGVLRSAGVGEIVDMVEDAWPERERGRVIQWEPVGSKFVVREVDAAAKKLSKSDG